MTWDEIEELACLMLHQGFVIPENDNGLMRAIIKEKVND